MSPIRRVSFWGHPCSWASSHERTCRPMYPPTSWARVRRDRRVQLDCKGVAVSLAAKVPKEYRGCMRCTSCGFENPEGMKFCGQCATPLSTRCPQCNFENPRGVALCGQCGSALVTQPAVQSQHNQSATRRRLRRGQRGSSGAPPSGRLLRSRALWRRRPSAGN
jgi:hypothetical protein